MMPLMLIVAVLGVLAIATALQMTPDTHRQISQHGDFRF